MKEIFVSKKYIALVDDEDYELISKRKWHIHKMGKSNYARSREKGLMQILMHTLITGYAMTDHIDGNGLNNQRLNLREATQAENMRNRGKTASNTSGYKGVTWFKRDKKWRAQIMVDGRGISLGYTIDLIEAALLYDRAARHYHGDFAWLNFPEVTNYSMLPLMKNK